MRNFVMAMITLLSLCLLVTVSTALAADTGSKLPANAQTALDQALADPPLSIQFLWEVNQDPKMMKLVQYAPVVVKIDRLTIYFSPVSDVQLTLEKSCGTTLMRGDTVKMIGCNDDQTRSCCDEMTMIMTEHRESDFWKALTSAIQPATGATRK